MNIKSLKKIERNGIVNRCKQRLKNKDVDYKLRFMEIYIKLFYIPQKEGMQILNYLFYKNIRKSDREVGNDEIDSLFDLLAVESATKEINNASMEELERDMQIHDAEMQYLEIYNEDRARERKYNEILKRDNGRKRASYY